MTAVSAGRAADGGGFAGGRPHMSGGKKFSWEKAIRFSEILDNALEVAAVFQEGNLEFLPERVSREDAEIVADLGEDVADRAIAELGSDLLRGGEIGENGVCVFCRQGRGTRAWFAGCGRRAGRTWRARVLPLLGQCGFERRRHTQAARDAREDQREVLGAEANRDPTDGD